MKAPVNPLLDATTESQWQAQIVRWARELGWTRSYHTAISRKLVKGWPDLVLLRPSTGELIYIEVKTMRGRLSDDQKQCDDPRRCGQEIYVWTPADERSVLARLAARPKAMAE